MNAQEIAEMYITRMGEWNLDYEVLWIFFQSLIDDTPVTEKDIEKALKEALLEWDV